MRSLLKGLSQPVAAYRPLAPRVDAWRPYRLQAFVLSDPLIGREAEFSILKNSVEDLRAGRGGIVMVTGDESPHFSQQYQMVAACEATAAQLGLVQAVAGEADRWACLRQALESSQAALDIYRSDDPRVRCQIGRTSVQTLLR